MSMGMKYVTVALLLTGGASVFYSCSEEKKSEEHATELVMTEQSENLTVVVSENGRRSYRFSTPLLEGYTLAADPYREFRKGIKIVTYQDDSLSSVDATLTANYAIYYEKRKLWEAKGNVEIHKSDGTEAYSQQMFWNSATKMIYSNVDTKLVTATDTYFTEGFESDEELNELRFRHWNGKMQFDEATLEKRDSLEEAAPDSGDRDVQEPATKNPSAVKEPLWNSSSQKSPRTPAVRHQTERKPSPKVAKPLRKASTEKAMVTAVASAEIEE